MIVMMRWKMNENFTRHGELKYTFVLKVDKEWKNYGFFIYLFLL